MVIDFTVDVTNIPEDGSLDPLSKSDLTTPYGQIETILENMANAVQAINILADQSGSDPLAIAGGVLTPTNMFHEITAQTGTTDNLDTITMGDRKFLFLVATAGDTITLRDGQDNINTVDGTDIDLTGNMVLFCMSYDFGSGSQVMVIGHDGNSGGGGGGGAPTDATYIVQTSDGDLTDEQALSSLATGVMKVTTGTGVISTAVANTDYAAATHASRHIRGGADEIDGDQIDVDVTLSNITPDTTPGEVSNVAHLGAIIKGIDNALSGGGGGAMSEIIAPTKLGSDTTSLSLTSIPATYQDLLLRLFVRSNGGGFDVDTYIGFNSDVSGNYDYIETAFDSAGIDSNTASSNQTEIALLTNGSSAPANAFTVFDIVIHNYAESDNYRNVTWQSFRQRSTNAANLRHAKGGAMWKNLAAAISSIQLSLSAGDFIADSAYALYGIGS